MQAAQVTDWSAGPHLTTIPRPEAPSSSSDLIQLRVVASAIHQVVRSRASGQHYTSGPLPHTPGVDGTGIDETTGKAYYFTVLGGGNPSTGTFSEYVTVKKIAVTPIPEGVDPIMAAALVNPVMSSWMALKYRAQLTEGWSALIMGATSASGKIAIRVARQLGAVKVYGAARGEAALKELDLDGYAVLNSDKPAETDFSAVSSATVLLDYLWGPWTPAYLSSTSSAGVKTPLQIISIGAMAGDEGVQSSAAIRSRDVTIRGAGPGAWSPAKLLVEMEGMLGVLKGMEDDGSGKLVKKMKMTEVEEAWKVKGPRVVLVNED
ncbi:quinone oxidoreductase [Sarocladium implicatum]|nr:quinone oxidoreductase [Sarocladium implicatum]